MGINVESKLFFSSERGWGEVLMKHSTDEELFRLIDGECSAEEQATLQQHLNQCAACQATFAELLAINQQLAQLITVEQPSVDFTNKLIDKWQTAPQASRRFVWGGTLRWFVISMGSLFTFTLVAGIVALLGSGAGTDVTSILPVTSYLNGLQQVFQNELLISVLLLIDGLLLLWLLDKAVLQPYYQKKLLQLTR